MRYIVISLAFLLYLPICSAEGVGALSGNGECSYATTDTHTVSDTGHIQLLRRLNGDTTDRPKRKKERKDRESTGRR